MRSVGPSSGNSRGKMLIENSADITYRYFRFDVLVKEIDFSLTSNLGCLKFFLRWTHDRRAHDLAWKMASW
jgi:hypothetical protein